MEDVQYGGRLVQGARQKEGGNVKVRTLSGTRAVPSQKCDALAEMRWLEKCHDWKDGGKGSWKDGGRGSWRSG